MADRMTMSAPWPHDLVDLVARAQAFTGWFFRLQDGFWDEGQVHGLRLIITIRHYDSYHPEKGRTTEFHYQVPASVFDRASWQRWIFDRCMDLWRHETGEALAFQYERPNRQGQTVTVLERPFAPFHGPGRDPNRNVEVAVDPMEARIPQEGVARYASDTLYKGRYPGYWWDGSRVHSDEEHDSDCGWGRHRCTPVQLVESSDA